MSIRPTSAFKELCTLEYQKPEGCTRHLNGQRCTFAHNIDDLQPMVCKYGSGCQREDCTFFHEGCETKGEWYCRKNGRTSVPIKVKDQKTTPKPYYHDEDPTPTPKPVHKPVEKPVHPLESLTLWPSIFSNPSPAPQPQTQPSQALPPQTQPSQVLPSQPSQPTEISEPVQNNLKIYAHPDDIVRIIIALAAAGFKNFEVADYRQGC